MYQKGFKTRKHIEDNFDLDEFKQFSYNERFENFKKKNKNLINILSYLIFILSIFIFFLLYQLANYYINLWRNKFIAESSNKIINVGENFNSQDQLVPVLEEFQNIQISDSNIISEKIINPKILNAREFYNNDEIIGFIKINNTNINYFVAQSTDNNFYLNKDLIKKNNVAGSIFMDYESNPEDLSQNTILYGHNMRDGSMFHNIRFYRSLEFFNENKYIEYISMHEETKWEIFAFYDTSTDFNYITANFQKDQDFDEFINQIKQKSIFISDIPINKEDKIITLSTCTNISDDTRYVIHAKLIETS